MINDDASSWYESGAVKDVTIKNKTLYKCGGPVIALSPENRAKSTARVHSGIQVICNKITLKDDQFFEASSTSGIKVTGNKITTTGSIKNIDQLISLKDCQDTRVYNNQLTKQKE
jgi:hypothetical protein